jgi:hypothetical protein
LTEWVERFALDLHAYVLMDNDYWLEDWTTSAWRPHYGGSVAGWRPTGLCGTLASRSGRC